LGADSRFSELEDENAAQSLCCQDLFFKLQTEGKVNWSPAQMKRLWNDKCCFRCGKQVHQWADCKANQPANPKAFANPLFPATARRMMILFPKRTRFGHTYRLLNQGI
jgi:hypothetical protein